MLLGEDLKEEGPCQESGSTCRGGRIHRSSRAPERIKALGRPRAFGAPDAALSQSVSAAPSPNTSQNMLAQRVKQQDRGRRSGPFEGMMRHSNLIDFQ